MGKARFFISLTGAILAWVALIQFSIDNSVGKPFHTFLAEFFTYFTIIGNFAIALYFTFQLFNVKNKLTIIFHNPGSSTAILAYITFVAIGYHTMFEDMYEPDKIHLGIDLLLHLIVPVLFLIYWLLYETQKDIDWNLLPSLLILPLIYFFYVLLVGAIINYYPYPFFDVDDSGYGEVMLIGLGFSLAVAIIGSAYIGLAKVLKKRN